LTRQDLDALLQSEPQWGPIGREVYERTYSRVKANGQRETWRDTVQRVVEGNLAFVDPRFIEPGEKEELLAHIYNFDILPAGRHLWVTGIKNRQFISNCFITHWDTKFSRHFTFLFERLMEGGGVGGNYSNKYLEQYSPFSTKIDLHFVCQPAHKDYQSLKHMLSESYSPDWHGSYTIGDSREGWTRSLEIILETAHNCQAQTTIVFDVSNIRPSGSRIKGFGGTSAGPLGLMEMLRATANELNNYNGQQPDSLMCMRIDHEIAKCVISGNSRRSARMSLKYWRDPDIFEFIHCKEDGFSHWSTNISIIIDHAFFRSLRRGSQIATKVAEAWANGALKNGEPGFLNIDKASEGELSEIIACNPCGEEVMNLPWEQCCLSHVNLQRFVNNPTGMYKAFRLTTRFLIRATFGDMPDEGCKKAIETNRRIGVGFTGFQGWLTLQGIRFSECHENTMIRRRLHKAYEIVRKEARDYAFQLRIPEPVKVTTIAPCGTNSKLPGVSEGMHTIFARYFKRRVCFSTVDPTQIEQLRELETRGFPIEESVYTRDTKVVTFIVKDPLVVEVASAGYPEDLIEDPTEIDLEDLLAVQAMIQEEFADNAISFTANLIPGQVTVDKMIKCLEQYGPRLKGSTVMPLESNRDQMPYEKITREEWETFHLHEIGQAETECQNGACPIK